MMEIKEYECIGCGLEVVIAKEKCHKLPKAECQDCGKMTLRCTGRRK